MVVTDAARAGRALPDLARSAVRGGADLVQVREAGLSDADLLALTRAVVDALASTPALVLVNERVDVALGAHAHGVHLKDRGLDPGEVRAALRSRGLEPPGFLVGVSTHDAAGLARALGGGGADLATVGPVAASPGKEPLGLDGLARLLEEARSLAGELRAPWLALGGVDAELVPALARLAAPGEAWGVAAIRPFLGAPESGVDPAERGARALRDALDRR